jgi:hypothetical protein
MTRKRHSEPGPELINQPINCMNIPPPPMGEGEGGGGQNGDPLGPPSPSSPEAVKKSSYGKDEGY